MTAGKIQRRRQARVPGENEREESHEEGGGDLGQRYKWRRDMLARREKKIMLRWRPCGGGKNVPGGGSRIRLKGGKSTSERGHEGMARPKKRTCRRLVSWELMKKSAAKGVRDEKERKSGKADD